MRAACCNLYSERPREVFSGAKRLRNISGYVYSKDSVGNASLICLACRVWIDKTVEFRLPASVIAAVNDADLFVCKTAEEIFQIER